LREIEQRQRAESREKCVSEQGVHSSINKLRKLAKSQESFDLHSRYEKSRAKARAKAAKIKVNEELC
jgi:hypothetical protein